MAPMAKNIELNLEVDVLTTGAVAEFVNEILEFLLFQRNQIPFVYKTYKYYVCKWSENENYEDNQELATSRQFQLQRQRDMAKQTKDSISDMRELIRNVFDNNDVRSLRFLLGSTTFTAKEAYTIHIPTNAISRQHSHAHHILPASKISQNLISLITHQELYVIFSSLLPATNLFLELELNDPVDAIEGNSDIVIPKDISQLPISCQNIHIYLQHVRPSQFDIINTNKCCSELHIYNEQELIGTIDNQQSKKQDKCNTSNECADTKTAWWEAKVVIRGFKEQLNKTFSMWSS